MKRQQIWLGILVMMVLCTITYANHFYNGFHFDDSHAVQNNGYIRNIHNIPLFFKDGSTSSALPQNQSYRPVVTTSLAIDYWLGSGYNLFVFQLSTFILFLLQGLLMVWFYRRIFNIAAPNNTFNIYISLIAVTWYLLHPAMAETINYIIARSDVLSTFFVVLAFVLYQHSATCRKYYLYLIPIIIGTLAKPPAIMFAPLLFVYILLFEEQTSFTGIFTSSGFKQLLSALKKSLPAFICCLFLYWLQGRLTPKTWQAGGTSQTLYLITQPFVILHYFQMLLVPNALSADTDWQLLPTIFNWRFFAGALFILVMLTIAFVTSKKAKLRPISFGIVWFFLALVPTSSIIPLAEVLNDHRMFFPFVGLCISIGWAIFLLVEKYIPRYKTPFIVALILLLSAYAYGTYQRNEVWHTEESLWHDVTLKSPANGRGLMNYGLAKMAAGDYVTANAYFMQALRLLPSYPSLYVNIGILKAATGNPVEAENWFKKAFWFGNNYPDPYLYYGRFLKEQARYPEAAINLQRTITIAPANLYAHLLLMEVYEKMGKKAELKALAQSTLQLSPDNAGAKKHLESAEKMSADNVSDKSPTAEKYLDQSLTYFNNANYPQCIETAQKALALKPGYGLAYNNICAAYNRLQDWDKAILAGQKGLRLNSNNQILKNNLAVAYKGKKETPADK